MCVSRKCGPMIGYCTYQLIDSDISLCFLCFLITAGLSDPPDLLVVDSLVECLVCIELLFTCNTQNELHANIGALDTTQRCDTASCTCNNRTETDTGFSMFRILYPMNVWTFGISFDEIPCIFVLFHSQLLNKFHFCQTAYNNQYQHAVLERPFINYIYGRL